MTSSSSLSRLLCSVCLFGACAGGPGPEPGPDSMDAGVELGRPVAAEDFCAALATLVCAADQACCSQPVAMDAGVAEAGSDAVDAGVMDSDVMDSAAFDAGPMEDPCVQRQRQACERSVGSLLEDGRTAYIPERGGTYLSVLATQGQSCFVEPPEMSDFMEVFEGTGGEDANCTPRSTSLSDLRISQLSCADGLTCHLYRRSDGSPLGICEPREDMDCSHPLDCAPGLWCNLTAGWEPGRWGTCQPARANDWDCTSDFECESRYCAPATGTCAPPPEHRYCATVHYEAAVRADAPVAYWRLSESDAPRSEIGEGLDGTYEGTNVLTAGAIHGDGDEAFGLGGDNHAVLPASVGELLSEEGMSLELWFRRDAASEGTGPLLEFSAGEESDRGVRIWNHDAADKVYVNLRDESEESHSLITAEGTIAVDTWYHIVVTYDGSVGRLYIDGERVGDDIPGSFTPQTHGPLYIGFREGDDRRVIGALDELAVYDRALSSTQVSTHARLGRDGPSDQPFVLFRWLE